MNTAEATKAAANLTIGSTKNGTRVHRATCKRAKNVAPLLDAAEFASTMFDDTGITAATCCKPADVVEVIAALSLAKAPEAPKTAKDVHLAAKAAKAPKAPKAPTKGKGSRPGRSRWSVQAQNLRAAEAAEAAEASSKVVFGEYGIPGRYWRSVAAKAAKELGKHTAAQVRTDSKAREVRISGSTQAVQDAHEAIDAAWLAINPALAAYRTGAAYAKVCKATTNSRERLQAVRGVALKAAVAAGRSSAVL